MINRLLIVFLTALAAGCTSQQMFGNHFYLVNNCHDTLTVTVTKYSNIDDFDKYTFRRPVLSGQEMEVALYRSYGHDLQKIISEEYKLHIEGQKSAVSLGKQELIARAIKSNKTNNHVASYWRFSSADLCDSLVGSTD